MNLRVFTDGASRGNPGEAGAGFLIQDADGGDLFHGKKYLGTMTNNVSEWNALLLGLQKAKEFEAKNVDCFLDSELVVKQMKGEYKVKNQDLRPLYERAKILVLEFKHVTFTHIPREQNTVADRLSNEAIDQKA